MLDQGAVDRYKPLRWKIQRQDQWIDDSAQVDDKVLRHVAEHVEAMGLHVAHILWHHGHGVLDARPVRNVHALRSNVSLVRHDHRHRSSCQLPPVLQSRQP